MALTKYKLGELIEPIDERNIDDLYTLDDVKGISTGKEFIDTKANMDGVSLSLYKVVNLQEFAYVADTSRRGEKIAIAFNSGNKAILISSIYTVFRISRKDILLDDYLFMYFNRPEFDRYARFNSWGSARETFDWDTMCDIDIELPDLPTQQKYVDIYKAMVANQQAYERGLEDLKLVCDGYIENLRRNMPCEKIGKYIRISEKNRDEKISNVLGIGQNGFIKPQKKPNESLKNYKIIRKGMIGYAPPLYNMLTGAIHYYDGETPAVCSPIYEVFECLDGLLPEYLILWLKREEFKRYASFFAAGVRGTFDYEFMEDVEIPIPDIDVQKAIANIYSIYISRKRINEQLKTQIKNICPILIKGSLEEGERS